MAPVDEGQRECARIAHAQFHAMMGLGHHPFLEAPEATAEMIRGFMAATPAQQPATDTNRREPRIDLAAR
jgi:hypothetical protein